MNNFVNRHIGPNEEQQNKMLSDLGLSNIDELVKEIVPEDILLGEDSLDGLPDGCSEFVASQELDDIIQENKIKRSLIGMGYFGCETPAPIQRHVLENPMWYTSYTPYQAEISQGRLEALFNFQTFITELTGLPIANASLLDEATAAVEAMTLSWNLNGSKEKDKYYVGQDLNPQILDALFQRAECLRIDLAVCNTHYFWEGTRKSKEFEELFWGRAFGAMFQLPNLDGAIHNYSSMISECNDRGVITSAIIDPMWQVLMKPVGEMGIDIAVGSAQRLGIPMGFGGPYAAFFATKEKYKRKVPGRIVGQSVDSEGNKCYRLALQTREQHIRRDKATSNICTAQALLATMSSFYVAYHGPKGLEKISKDILKHKLILEYCCGWLGLTVSKVKSERSYDTVFVWDLNYKQRARFIEICGFNLRTQPMNDGGFLAITIDELTDFDEIDAILRALAPDEDEYPDLNEICNEYIDVDKYLNGKKYSVIEKSDIDVDMPLRDKPWLQQEVFNKYHSETDLTRYIHKLALKDFSLVNGMIPLGSCTMKLNAVSELQPVSSNKIANIHPFAPDRQYIGYKKIIDDLKNWLSIITGFDGVTLQPNSGAQGEYTGLLVISKYHANRNEPNRNICLIPTSAHGTNPASAVLTGMNIVPVLCDEDGNIDINDLRKKAEDNSENLAALMITYPSTHGVFELGIREMCDIVHQNGGQVYLDGANLNAQVGLAKPADYGIDVCHLNLHKTFCIPHGGGGPGVGPVAVAPHLVNFLPLHAVVDVNGNVDGISNVSSSPWGSASILPITWMYIRMMGKQGLRNASEVALLNANWISEKLDPYFKVLYKGFKGRVAHECIIDIRQFKSKGITAEDVAKRLMDYGFHAPTLSWPVTGTMMIEPTESESLDELERFFNAMYMIRGEIEIVPSILTNAPHTMKAVTEDEWDRPYTRQQAAFPIDQKDKFWPAVSRIDNVRGDRNLVCSCSVPIE